MSLMPPSRALQLVAFARQVRPPFGQTLRAGIQRLFDRTQALIELEIVCQLSTCRRASGD